MLSLSSVFPYGFSYLFLSAQSSHVRLAPGASGRENPARWTKTPAFTPLEALQTTDAAQTALTLHLNSIVIPEVALF